MKTYWDLSESERAKLTREEVETFVDAELMTRGVLKVDLFKPEEVPVAPAPRTRFHRIRFGGHRHEGIDLAFDDAHTAREFLKLGVRVIDRTWVGSRTVECVKKIEEPEIFESGILTHEEALASHAQIRLSEEAKKRNEEGEREHRKAIEEQQAALADMWSDWHDQRDKAERLRRVVETFADYTKTAGDEATAAKFLRKVFPIDTIAQASEWFGIAIPAVPASEQA